MWITKNAPKGVDRIVFALMSTNNHHHGVASKLYPTLLLFPLLHFWLLHRLLDLLLFGHLLGRLDCLLQLFCLHPFEYYRYLLIPLVYHVFFKCLASLPIIFILSWDSKSDSRGILFYFFFFKFFVHPAFICFEFSLLL